MDILERIFGVDTMQRARAAQAEAQSQARGGRRPAAVPQQSAPRPSADTAVPVPTSPSRPQRAVSASFPAPSDDAAFDSLPAALPTSILGTAPITAPPLLAAFGSREALLAALVFSEALALPVALRQQPFSERSS